MKRLHLRPMTTTCALWLAVCPLVAAMSRAPAADLTRTVYVSVTDASGATVTDVKPADLAIKEGGKERQIASVGAATAPMQIGVIIDDRGSGMFQLGLATFIERTFGHADFSVRVVNNQALKVVDYTRDVDALKGAIAHVNPRGAVQPDGDQLIEAISDTARELQKMNAARPVIVVITGGGEAAKAVMPDDVLDHLKNSGASLHVISVAGTSIGQVLGDGPRQSGGRSEQVGAVTGVAGAMTKLADLLLHQYVITYTLPDGVKPNERLSVTLNRKGASLLAPTLVRVK